MVKKTLGLSCANNVVDRVVREDRGLKWLIIKRQWMDGCSVCKGGGGVNICDSGSHRN